MRSSRPCAVLRRPSSASPARAARARRDSSSMRTLRLASSSGARPQAAASPWIQRLSSRLKRQSECATRSSISRTCTPEPCRSRGRSPGARSSRERSASSALPPGAGDAVAVYQAEQEPVGDPALSRRRRRAPMRGGPPSRRQSRRCPAPLASLPVQRRCPRTPPARAFAGDRSALHDPQQGRAQLPVRAKRRTKSDSRRPPLARTAATAARRSALDQRSRPGRAPGPATSGARPGASPALQPAKERHPKRRAASRAHSPPRRARARLHQRPARKREVARPTLAGESSPITSPRSRPRE